LRVAGLSVIALVPLLSLLLPLLLQHGPPRHLHPSCGTRRICMSTCSAFRAQSIRSIF
jgi:hypothetical protein